MHFFLPQRVCIITILYILLPSHVHMITFSSGRMMPRLDERDDDDESRFLSSEATDRSAQSQPRDIGELIARAGWFCTELGIIVCVVGIFCLMGQVPLAWVAFAVGAGLCVTGVCMYVCGNPRCRPLRDYV